MCRFAAFAMSVMVALGTVTASAQEPAKESAKPPALPPVLSTPERTTASFGDWILRCEAATAAAKRTCEVALVLTAQGQTAPIAQVAIGREPADKRPMTVVLPHNVLLTARLRITLAKDAKSPLEFVWQKCTPGACFASVALSAEAVAGLRAQTEAGKIIYTTAAEQEIALPLSMRGLAQALDAMAKEP